MYEIHAVMYILTLKFLIYSSQTSWIYR